MFLLGVVASSRSRTQGINDAVAAGTISTEQAQRLMQVEQALRPLIIAQALAEGDAKGTLARVIDALRGA